MYTLKKFAQRGTTLGLALSLFAATMLPAATVLADALNPLTERSLLLTSSAPGFMDSDGSGNSSASPNSIGENYAPAGSGPNGKRSGQTFTFTHTSDSEIKGFSLQYCTTAAGLCQAPGNNTGDARTSTRLDNETPLTGGHALGTSDFNFVVSGDDGEEPPVPYGWVERGTAIPAGPLPPLGEGNGEYQVLIDGILSTGWNLTMANLEDDDYVGDGTNNALTGKNNYVTLVNSTGVTIDSGDVVEIRFRPSENVYITNPGSKEFFVKINTYNDTTMTDATDLIGPHNDMNPDYGYDDESDPADPPLAHNIIDGGVTVANVMTDSIHITTKVLETMSFSVGTQNRDTVDIGGAGQSHGKCDPILTPNNNRLNLGNPSAEYSLETGRAWDVYSYWRLSSNSSGGASVYYSGDTLRNTVGDHIAEMDEEVASAPGQEQFGLGFVDAGLDTMDANGAVTWANGDAATHKGLVRSYPFITMLGQGSNAPYDTLGAQAASEDYDEATGTLYDDSGQTVQPGTAKFKFLSSSLTVPELIAKQSETVISCATAKMRYVANIGADTPAGVYTTKINYLAAPQY